MLKLGVNVDHVATLRQARREFEPDPIEAARICLKAGAHSIVAHLREDRRHINDRDMKELKGAVKTKLNMEMSVHPEIVRIATHIKPNQATLVPERRQEITTEGGLDVVRDFVRIKRVTGFLQRKGIVVSLFIDPDRNQIKKAKETEAHLIELHTGPYARAKTKTAIKKELHRLVSSVKLAQRLGLEVAAGHGLNYENVPAIVRIKEIRELNIGHSIISRAVFVGLEKAVKDMLRLMGSK